MHQSIDIDVFSAVLPTQQNATEKETHNKHFDTSIQNSLIGRQLL
jgi:hypothetical protein